MKFYEKIINKDCNELDCNEIYESMAKEHCNLFIEKHRVKNTYNQENTISK